MTDAGETWLTSTEVARRLGRPESTVRYWRNTYREHIEERLDRAGHRVYRLAPFARIATLMEAGASRSEVARILAEDGAAESEGFEARLLALLERLVAAVERIADQLDRRKEGA